MILENFAGRGLCHRVVGRDLAIFTHANLAANTLVVVKVYLFSCNILWLYVNSKDQFGSSGTRYFALGRLCSKGENENTVGK